MGEWIPDNIQPGQMKLCNARCPRFESQRPEEAARLAQEVLSRNPGHPNAQHLFGYALLMQDRAEEAIAPLEKAFRALRDPAL